MRDFFKNKYTILLSLGLFFSFITIVGILYCFFHNSTIMSESNPISIKKAITMEINSNLPKIYEYFDNMDLIDSSATLEIKYMKDNSEVEVDTTKLGRYNVKIIYNSVEYPSSLEIVDTTKPEVELYEVTIQENKKYSADIFIFSYNDNSKNTSYVANFTKAEDSNKTKVGTYPIDISVCDKNNNCVTKTTTLHITDKDNSNLKGTTKVEKVVINETTFPYGIRKISYQNVTFNLDEKIKIEVKRSEPITKMNYSLYNGTVRNMFQDASNRVKFDTKMREEIVEGTNKLRRELGLNELVEDSNLDILATIKAMEIAYSGKFDHVRPDGRDWESLHKEFYEYAKLETPLTYGENLARGKDSNGDVMASWTKSKEHYENMVKDQFNKIGVGKIEFNGVTYWVQVFSS